MKCFVSCVLMLFSLSVLADVPCHEKITQVITHGNGNIYFKTDSTCSDGWCFLDWNTREAIEAGYSLLLTAKASDSFVQIQWADIDSCSDKNVTFAVPRWMGVK